jgi:phage tail-like protein
MPLAEDNKLALANRFKVKVIAPNAIDLGSWQKISGLDVTFDVVEYRAGDSWNSRWYAPGMSKYSLVTLERTLSADTEKVKKWVSDTAKGATPPGQMVITLQDAAGEDVYEWEMRSAMVAKWSFSGLDATASKLAMETLQVVHLGFLDDDMA